MARAGSFVPLLDAAYATEGDDTAWLLRVMEAAAPRLDRGSGIQGVIYDASNPKDFRAEHLRFLGCTDQVAAVMTRATHSLSEQIVRDSVLSRTVATSTETLGPKRLAAFLKQLGLGPGGPRDTIAVNAVDPTGRGVLVQALSPKRMDLSANERTAWERMAAHLVTGHRLRRGLRASALPPLDGAEAVLDDRGRVAHAVGIARARDAREALRTAARKIDSARTRARPAAALALWPALIDGRWSIIDQFDSDGRRFFVALKNDPTLMPERRLSDRERQVASYAALGHANKLIAYELGLSLSTVASHLATARQKLGVANRLELIAIMRALVDR